MLTKTQNNYKWFALSCTTLGALLSVISGSSLTIALPLMAKELHASIQIVVWTMLIYLLSITILVPSIGRIADIIGRKKLYVSGFAVFTFSSLLCYMVNNGYQLILARLVQSIGGALMLANSTTIVTDAFPREELGRALGINGMVVSAGAVIGPIIGGILTAINWRWIFLFNVPLGIIGTIWAAVQLREIVKLPEGQHFDWYGTILFTAGMTLLLLAVTLGSLIGWQSLLTLFGFAGGLLLIVGFVYVESHVDQPMLDLSLFKQRLLAAAYSCNFLNGIARGCVTFLMIFFFQIIWKMDPLNAGILMAPFAAAMTVVAPLSGYLSDLYGSRELSSLGLLVSAIGLFGLTKLSIHTSLHEVMAWMVIMGAGSGFFFSPNTNAIMGAVTSEHRGIAAGTRTMMNNAGTMISMAIGLTLVTSSISSKALNGLMLGIQVGTKGVAVNEFITGLHHTFFISFVISLIATVVALMRGPKQPDIQKPSTDTLPCTVSK